ncbi:plasmid replication initiator protein [Kitasatospora acidiphila]|uniref:Plasmid replication initiator protein n=1 Tax=Kitasatospora acidiphila TaxID=2567942 RepID=A0A540WGR1_9ACTN|nr:plasmid replication initiator protein [Kitasatospora acidiphila]
MRALPDIDRDLVRLGQQPGLNRWLDQIRATGGCAAPIYLAGQSVTTDATTGEVLHSYSTDGEPGSRLAVRCRNRRASRCQPCSREHAGDTFHLVRAGLVGGKGVPDEVRTHPRLFATLTAPSFGSVHRAGACHPVRRRRCQHGSPQGCGRFHDGSDLAVGQPLCPDCYDYTAHILWNAHGPALWKAFRDNLYHHLAARAGVGRSTVRKLLRVSAAKVTEYQKRGVVHFHAVIRLDGPTGPDSSPPAWATSSTLLGAVPSAAAAVSLTAPISAAYGTIPLRFGTQLEAHELTIHLGRRLTDEAVAAYIAKYTSKSVESAGAVDHRINSLADFETLPVTPHVRALIGTAWRLGSLPELHQLRLRAWAHMLGYRGHCLTKTRAFSATYTDLRAARADHTRGQQLFADWDSETVTESTWRYVGQGHTPAEQLIAAGIAEDLAVNRNVTRDERRHDDHGSWHRAEQP